MSHGCVSSQLCRLPSQGPHPAVTHVSRSHLCEHRAPNSKPKDQAYPLPHIPLQQLQRGQQKTRISFQEFSKHKSLCWTFSLIHKVCGELTGDRDADIKISGRECSARFTNQSPAARLPRLAFSFPILQPDARSAHGRPLLMWPAWLPFSWKMNGCFMKEA